MSTLTPRTRTNCTPYGGSVTAAPPSGGTAPAITVQPSDQSKTAPAAATFSVTATGTAPLNYQWYRNGSPVPGATSASYVIDPTATSMDADYFRVTVTNLYGSATSSYASLYVVSGAAPSAPAITIQPTAISFPQTVGGTYGLSAVASGYPAPTWQWYEDVAGTLTEITETSTAAFIRVSGAGLYFNWGGTGTPAVSGSNIIRYYRAKATNASGSATSNATAVTMTTTGGGNGTGLSVTVQVDPAILNLQPNTVDITVGGAAIVQRLGSTWAYAVTSGGGITFNSGALATMPAILAGGTGTLYTTISYGGNSTGVATFTATGWALTAFTGGSVKLHVGVSQMALTSGKSSAGVEQVASIAITVSGTGVTSTTQTYLSTDTPLAEGGAVLSWSLAAGALTIPSDFQVLVTITNKADKFNNVDISNWVALSAIWVEGIL